MEQEKISRISFKNCVLNTLVKNKIKEIAYKTDYQFFLSQKWWVAYSSELNPMPFRKNRYFLCHSHCGSDIKKSAVEINTAIAAYTISCIKNSFNISFSKSAFLILLSQRYHTLPKISAFVDIKIQ
ncbi:hypothetical protein ONV78_13265 [Hahella sp. CR1]|uniref:hypothetical protein n=1 Tax=Hahella sp. CR1 TaxID=2992807 RepID=UPI002441147F|nr:hypothetical protein [Hahella sp. CR1]MDG9668706.1 hypothetical protein [Hahella sp. CR1]